MKRILLLLLLILNQSLFGQNRSKQDLLLDLTYLGEAFVNAHPINYNQLKKLNIQPIIDSAKQIKTDSISTTEYTLWIEKGIYHIGCVHTSIKDNPLPFNNNKLFFIPLTASIVNEKLVITSCSDSSKIGQFITSINGVNANTLIEKFKEYKASDGGSNAFSKEYFHYASSKIISNYLYNPSQFIVNTSNDEFELDAINSIYLFKQNNKPVNSILSNDKNSFYALDDFAVLKINSFRRNDRKYFISVFKKLDELNYGKLILDLRQNTGGNRDAAVELTRFLVDTTISYSILQPNLKINNYLNTKGKFYLVLSKLKYNIGALFKKRKTSFGKEYVFNYKTKTKNHYNGKIYVLTDGFTASSSTMVTSWLKQFTNAIFMGSQAGGGYNGNNGGSFPLITLPNSKIQVKFPAYRLILDYNSDQKSGIIPETYIAPNTEITEIMRLINNR